MKTANRGAQWEALAESYLQKRGLDTVARNYHCRLGEIDLVMHDGDATVFVEVRFRNNPAHGTGADSVGPAKRQRITRAAMAYLAAHPRAMRTPCRFDVISVAGTGPEPKVTWLRNAFESPAGNW